MKLLTALLSAIAAASVIAVRPNVIPLPANYTSGSTNITLADGFFFDAGLFGGESRLNRAIDRYTKQMFPLRMSTVRIPGGDLKRFTSSAFGLMTLEIKVDSDDEGLYQETDESYELNIPNDSVVATLSAKTIYGAMRGLETFSQMVEDNYDLDTKVINFCPWNIQDSPRFGFRGLLIDTSRHFLPVRTIFQVIDSMVYAKLNVLHWHIVDAQSFPLEVKSFPKLWEGAYSPAERYTQKMVAAVVEYAKDRAVRVMAEADGPGHMYAWGVGYPELLPEDWDKAPNCDNKCLQNKNTNPCDVPVNPAVDFTYQVLDGTLSELTGNASGQGLFPEDFFHLGGDEVETGCWTLSPTIKDMMSKSNFTTYDQVYEFYIKKIQTMALSKGRIPVHWEEVFVHFGTQLDKKIVIHIWKDFATLKTVLAAGYRAIVSNSDVWYLDHLDTPWEKYYDNEPMAAVDPAHPEQAELILGGEVCMWGETVDTSNVLFTIWPKAAAGAERLWSPQSVTDHTDFLYRLQRFHCLLHSRGTPAGPVGGNSRDSPVGPSSCYIN